MNWTGGKRSRLTRGGGFEGARKRARTTAQSYNYRPARPLEFPPIARNSATARGVGLAGESTHEPHSTEQLRPSAVARTGSLLSPKRKLDIGALRAAGRADRGRYLPGRVYRSSDSDHISIGELEAIERNRPTRESETRHESEYTRQSATTRPALPEPAADSPVVAATPEPRHDLAHERGTQRMRARTVATVQQSRNPQDRTLAAWQPTRLNLPPKRKQRFRIDVDNLDSVLAWVKSTAHQNAHRPERHPESITDGSSPWMLQEHWSTTANRASSPTQLSIG